MSDNGSIDILITKNVNPEGTKPSAENFSNQPGVSKDEPGKPNMQQQAVNAQLINSGKQIMMNGIQSFNRVTGNHARTRQMNSLMSAGADLLMIAYGGPVGVIAVATKHINAGINAYAETIEREREYEFHMQRVGKISQSGSR